MFPISTLHNKIFNSANFKEKNLGRKSAENRKNRANFFTSKSAKMKILLCNVDMGNRLYEVKFFYLWSKKLELMKQIHLFKKGFVIFFKGATFSDFIETGILNYITSGIHNRFPLFWRIYFQLGSNLIK